MPPLRFYRRLVTSRSRTRSHTRTHSHFRSRRRIHAAALLRFALSSCAVSRHYRRHERSSPRTMVAQRKQSPKVLCAPSAFVKHRRRRRPSIPLPIPLPVPLLFRLFSAPTAAAASKRFKLQINVAVRTLNGRQRHDKCMARVNATRSHLFAQHTHTHTQHQRESRSSTLFESRLDRRVRAGKQRCSPRLNLMSLRV